MPAFNPLDHPAALLLPKRLSALSAWVGHVPFAFAVMDMLQPHLFVELGTHMGDSYCAFCQAVAELELPSRCVAIDTWEGDVHSGAYDGDAAFDALRAHQDSLYGAFSELRRSTFDAALGSFADGSIDLLHIDGLHTYDAVKHDFETWRPKLSGAGVVLFHDTQVRTHGFGVWRLWEDLTRQYPHFEFHHSSGLGVAAVGSHPPEALREFLAQAAEQPEDVRDYFTFLGDGVARVRAHWMVMSSLQKQRTLLDQWRSDTGQPARPVKANVATSLDYLEVTEGILHDLEGVLQENARLRSRPSA